MKNKLSNVAGYLAKCFVPFGGISSTVSFGLAMGYFGWTASHKITNHGSNKFFLYALEGNKLR